MKNQVLDAFKGAYGTEADVLAFAPGRLEILGNHTDYNEGFTLSTAVDMGTFFAARKIEGTTCTVKSINNDSVRTFDLNNLMEKTKGDWSNYIKGVLVEMTKRDIKPVAFEAVILGNVPLSAGMSSSASLEMATAYAIGKLTDPELFATLPVTEWAKIGQGAENNYIGANTGLLDQLTSLKGAPNALVFSDFRTLDVDTISIPEGAALVVANSMVKHDLTEEYNERRENCEKAAAYFNGKDNSKTHLRDVSLEELEAAKADLCDMTYGRARHVVEENTRVHDAIACLGKGDIKAFGQLLCDSHKSSMNNFENSCPELDILVEEGSKLDGFIGARLSGGGFGGISIHLVEADKAEAYAKTLEANYVARTGKETEMFICNSGAGAWVE